MFLQNHVPEYSKMSYCSIQKLEKNMYIVYCCPSATKSCPTLCDPMDCSAPGFPVYHQLLELPQIHVHQVSLGKFSGYSINTYYINYIYIKNNEQLGIEILNYHLTVFQKVYKLRGKYVEYLYN